jgi:hypothetical protein
VTIQAEGRVVSKLTVTVTSRTAGTWTVAPYNHEEGLGPRPGTVYEMPVYEVPLYEVTVGTEMPVAVFKAVRFGLVRNDEKPPPERTCDNGLADGQVVKPSWRPAYSPHSFDRVNRPGAWQLYPDKGWLIHEGTAARYDGSPGSPIGGSFGCIELVGPFQWNAFLNAVEKRAGEPCTAIGAKHNLTVIIEHAVRPQAKLLLTVPWQG